RSLKGNAHFVKELTQCSQETPSNNRAQLSSKILFDCELKNFLYIVCIW
uniref:FGF n=1 Tax=Parascaris univalens TaxID=6257 RepID=A0A915C3Z5_PARUN